MSDAIKKPADFDGWRARDAYDMGYRHGRESAALDNASFSDDLAERLAMAEGLLRKAELDYDEGGTFGTIRVETPYEAEYLRSLDGEDE